MGELKSRRTPKKRTASKSKHNEKPLPIKASDVVSRQEEAQDTSMLRNGLRAQATQLGPETDEMELAETGKHLSPNLNGDLEATKEGGKSDVLRRRSLSPAMTPDRASAPLSPADQRAIVLLVVLCGCLYILRGIKRISSKSIPTPPDLLQGIPVGLAFGSIPYLLRAKLSYSQIGIFSLASYPYSLKLLWSPIVDSCYNPKWGRRKSWIVPVQFMVGCMLYWLSRNVPVLMEKEVPDVEHLTILFFILVFLAATQGA